MGVSGRYPNTIYLVLLRWARCLLRVHDLQLIDEEALVDVEVEITLEQGGQGFRAIARAAGRRDGNFNSASVSVSHDRLVEYQQCASEG